MAANPLKALLIIGVDQPPLSYEITKFYNREDCLIIGDGTRDISIEDIKKELKEKNFVLDNTRIDIKPMECKMKKIESSILCG